MCQLQAGLGLLVHWAPGLQIHLKAHGPGSRGAGGWNQAKAVFQLGLPVLRARFPEPSSSLDNGHLSSHKGPQNHQEANTSEPRTTASPAPGTQGWRHPRQVFPGALQGLWAPSSSLLPKPTGSSLPPCPDQTEEPGGAWEEGGRVDGAYSGPWPGSCCRSRRGCRACGRRTTPPGRCPPRRSPPRRSR